MTTLLSWILASASLGFRIPQEYREVAMSWSVSKRHLRVMAF